MHGMEYDNNELLLEDLKDVDQIKVNNIKYT